MRSDRLRLAVLMWLALAAPAAVAQPAGGGERPAASASADEPRSTPGTAAPRTRQTAPFVPSETIPPGTAVPFPVDI